jgi:hydrogenase maturation protease
MQPYAQAAVPIAWPATDEGPAQGVARSRQPSGARRVLVAGVGYRNLRDLSAGPILIDRLRTLAWPPGVDVEDLSFGAVHVLHWLEERPPFDAALLVAAVARGREPGSLTRSTWSTPQLPAEAVQERVAEAVTGVISLDTLLIVLGYFAALPPRVTIIEIEPLADEWGPALSSCVETALAEAERLVEHEVQVLIG